MDQQDDWSCGIHVIANAMAFICFEVLGWHNIQHWSNVDGKLMREELLVGLHRLLGLKYWPNERNSEIRTADAEHNVLPAKPLPNEGKAVDKARFAQSTTTARREHTRVGRAQVGQRSTASSARQGKQVALVKQPLL